MKINIPKEWILNRVPKEEGLEIGAGASYYQSMKNNKESIGQRIVMDKNWYRNQSLFQRLFIRLFRCQINRVVKVILCRGMERGIVVSSRFHELAGICDRMLWPEYVKSRASESTRVSDRPQVSAQKSENSAPCSSVARVVLDSEHPR